MFNFVDAIVNCCFEVAHTRVDNYGHDIYVIAVSSSTGVFVLGSVYP
jgi:hypothetical protein